MTSLPPELLQAFADTHYIVHQEAPLVMHIGKHPSNNWPGEVSVLVLGLDLEAAKSLARHYEQHAFVWAAGDGVPVLVQP